MGFLGCELTNLVNVKARFANFENRRDELNQLDSKIYEECTQRGLRKEISDL